MSTKVVEPDLDASDQLILKELYKAKKRLMTREIAGLLDRNGKSLAKNLSRLSKLGYVDNERAVASFC